MSDFSDALFEAEFINNGVGRIERVASMYEVDLAAFDQITREFIAKVWQDGIDYALNAPKE